MFELVNMIFILAGVVKMQQDDGHITCKTPIERCLILAVGRKTWKLRNNSVNWSKKLHDEKARIHASTSFSKYILYSLYTQSNDFIFGLGLKGFTDNFLHMRMVHI